MEREKINKIVGKDGCDQGLETDKQANSKAITLITTSILHTSSAVSQAAVAAVAGTRRQHLYIVDPSTDPSVVYVHLADTTCLRNWQW